jgi:hypothetical protein
MGFVAHIPHYVAQFDYPPRPSRCSRVARDVTGLQWDVERSRRPARGSVEIATQIADSDDVRDVVTRLEQQYDAFHVQGGPTCSPRTSRLPSGDEIGAQFEQFLAGLDDKPDGGEQ